MSLSIVLHPSGYKKEGAQPEIFTNLWSREQYVPKNRRSIYAEDSRNPARYGGAQAVALRRE